MSTMMRAPLVCSTTKRSGTRRPPSRTRRSLAGLASTASTTPSTAPAVSTTSAPSSFVHEDDPVHLGGHGRAARAAQRLGAVAVGDALEEDEVAALVGARALHHEAAAVGFEDRAGGEPLR